MEDMDQDMMRHGLLMELIDKMHGRLADKMFPPDPSLTDKPAVEGIVMEPKTAEGVEVPADMPPAADEDEMSDEELDELMKK